uniref:GDP-fucose protein O-fucosyltransferase 2 n=1 Tax=Angiostrongylus cantonensis TaxID=6313 RepID=A0A0K0CUN2_ANGCA
LIFSGPFFLFLFFEILFFYFQRRSWFFSYDEVRAKKFECISFQGDSETLKKLILNQYPETSSIFIDRGEAILHQHYGDVHYWQARRSMRYAGHLVEIGNFFRTQLAVSFREDVKNRKAIGGNFLCAHWRRKDFLRAHGDELPSIDGTAKQLHELCEKARVTRIFLATDASEPEVEQLSAMLRVPVLRFKNSTLPDGAVAIIDQWICAHARVFVGSHVSTFSYRIQEDREILGFAPNTTFNRLCPDKLSSCEQPAKWTIVYE